MKIACESKNNCEYKKKELYFLCHTIFNNVTIIVNVHYFDLRLFWIKVRYMSFVLNAL
jgi:hypothetical protein